MCDKVNFFLESNFILHIDMIESLKRGNAIVIDAQKEGVLLFNKLANIYMISAKNDNAYRQLISNISSANAIVAHQDFYVFDIVQRFKLNNVKKCWQSAYLSDRPLGGDGCKYAVVKLLTHQDADFVYSNYSLHISKAYIIERIAAGQICGAYIGEKLVGFIGMHQDGSIGILEVLNEFRNKGIATLLVSTMVKNAIELGWIPYAQSIVGNRESFDLQRKLNFQFEVDEYVYWIER